MRSEGASGSQQTVLMDNVLDCHPLPLELGAPAAPGHPTTPSVPPAGGGWAVSLMGPPASSENSREAAG